MSQVGCFSRFIGFLFLIGLVAIGGFIAYQAGIAQGIAQAPELAETIQSAPPVTLGVPWFFNIFAAICGSIFFLFLFFGVVRFIFCSTRFSKDGAHAKDNKLNPVV